MRAPPAEYNSVLHRDQAPLLRGGLVDDLLGDLEVVGDGWLVLADAGLQEFVHGE